MASGKNYNKQSVDLNAIMLASMGRTSNDPPPELDPNLRTVSRINPFKAVILTDGGDEKSNNPRDPIGSFSWLIK